MTNTKASQGRGRVMGPLAAAALTVTLLAAGTGSATAAGTPVADVVPRGLQGLDWSDRSSVELTRFKGQMYLTPSWPGDPHYRTQLYRWNKAGVPERVTRPQFVRKVRGATVVGDWLYFVGRDPKGTLQVYRTKGGSAKVQQVSALKEGYSTLDVVKNVGDTVYLRGWFEAWNTPEHTLRSVGGVTRKVLDDVTDETRLFHLGTRSVFFARAPRDPGLYVTDGTDAGTSALALGAPFDMEANDLEPEWHAVRSGNRLYFAMAAPGMANALWVTDGTTAGTHVIRELPAAHTTLTSVPGGVVFGVQGTTGGPEIWFSSGTVASTRRMAAGQGLGAGAVLGTDYFFTRPGSPDLWKVDTVTGRTSQVTWFGAKSGVTPAALAYPSAQRGHLYFLAHDPLHGAELWSTDGGPASMVREVTSGPAGTAVRNLQTAGKAVWFTAAARRVKGQKAPQSKLWRITNGADRQVIAPALRASARQRQGQTVRLVLRVGAGERFTGRVRGTVSVGKKSFALPRQKVTLHAGQVGRMTVELTGATGRKVLRAVKAWRAAPKTLKKQRLVRATPRVVYRDAAGNRATRTVSISLT